MLRALSESLQMNEGFVTAYLLKWLYKLNRASISFVILIIWFGISFMFDHGQHLIVYIKFDWTVSTKLSQQCRRHQKLSAKG
jgi:hypothetical protein